MSRVTLAIAAVALALLSWTLGTANGYRQGHKAGQLKVQAETNGKAVDELQKLLAGTGRLITRANAASTELRNATAARQRADEQLLKDFDHVLKKSAAGRAGCVFDADSMRQLEAARQRASSAAAGISGRDAAAVPAAAAAEREQRR